MIELTQQGQPHLHSLFGGFHGGRRSNCRRKGVKLTPRHAFNACKHKSICIEHEFIKAWVEVTGDSFMVYVRSVFSIQGVSSYLSKYMTKSFEEFAKQKELGFGKRWTQSLGWPKLERMALRGTVNKSWRRVMIGRWNDPGVDYGTVLLAKYLIDQDSNPDDGDSN